MKLDSMAGRAEARARRNERAVFYAVSKQMRIVMKHSKFHPWKNDICFAFLMASVFAITVAGAIAGYRDLARGRVEAADFAKTKEAPAALRGAGEKISLVTRDKPGR